MAGDLVQRMNSVSTSQERERWSGLVPNFSNTAAVFRVAAETNTSKPLNNASSMFALRAVFF